MTELMPKKKTNNLQRDLEKAYDEALKNEDFKELVVKLKRKREELIHYTSTLEDCALEYSHCKDCKGLAACQNAVAGYAYLPMVNEGQLTFGYRPCKYTNKEAKKNKHLKNTYAYNEPNLSIDIKKTKKLEVYI